MTEAGWRWILHEITTMRIEMPEEPMIAIEAKAWMDGYLRAQTDILKRLEEMQQQQSQ